MPPGLETLADADLRLEWADKHIEKFEGEIRLFHERESYVVSEQPHIQHGVPGGKVVRLDQPPPIPPHLMLIAYDAIHNLRVALDYMACALAVANGKTVSSVY
ncbi:MAG TPA: hypothetical protein VGP41_12745 [Candidatus Lustribacter sp.]|jgi:hypothetical protein|nr:hypothetical protein [Candidatus Lustribacter sp.]